MKAYSLDLRKKIIDVYKQEFEAFVIRKLIPKLWKGAVVIWDNYSIHKGQEIEKAITKAGAKLIYLPPYSADFNQSRKLLVKN